MKKTSRTEHSVRNSSVALVTKIISLFFAYATRVVFTHTLNESYVGINGLFIDILNVLSLSELGVGTAITYALYKPIAQGQIEMQKTLMRFYRNFYRIISVVILCIGASLIPFMDYIIKDVHNVDNLILIYCLYLANTVLSYQVVYKKTLIDAHQLNYITTIYQLVFLMLQYTLQIILLLTTHNFILYLIVYIVCTFAGNICVQRRADKMYPFLKERQVQKLSEENRNEIFRNIRAMIMHKVGTVVVNNTDNLIISAYVGVVDVGRYSNYYLVIGSMQQLLNQAFLGIMASVGNLGVTENTDRIKKIFDSIFFINQWVYGVSSICLYEVLSKFIELSFGEQYVFAKTVVIILSVNFYITGMRQATLIFRDSLGIFWYDRYKSIAEAIINLVASIVLVQWFGIIGVFVGTFISTITTSFWIEPMVLYRHRLKRSPIPYFIRYILYTCITVVSAIITDYACRGITGGSWMVLVIRLAICLVIPDIIMLICYHRTKEFSFIMGKLRYIMTDIKNKLSKGN